MEPIEIQARTVEEAISIALQRLNASRNEVRVDVVSEGKSGLLGIGSEEAIIRVERLEPDAEPQGNASEIVTEILEKLLELMELEGTVHPQKIVITNGEEQITSPLAFNVEGEDLGILIGRRGQTMAALQYIVRLMVNHQTMEWTPVVIDIEGYKQRRSEALQALAARIAEQVRTRRTPFTLEPMPAYERRIIHLALADHPDVTTESTGEGEFRKVVILPNRNAR